MIFKIVFVLSPTRYIKNKGKHSACRNFLVKPNYRPQFRLEYNLLQHIANCQYLYQKTARISRQNPEFFLLSFQAAEKVFASKQFVQE